MDNKFRLKAIFLILVLIFAAYSNSLYNKFVWDDEFLVVDNSLIKNPHLFPKIFSTDLFHNNPLGATNYYRPLQTLSYILDYSLFKLNPWGFHLINILLHFFNAVLVYGLLGLLTKDNFISFWGAILFSLHPAQVEAVTYISGRADLLFGIFFFSSFILYIKHRDYPKPKISHLYLASLLLFLLALLSKELAVVLPLVIVIYDLFIRKLEPKKYIGFFLLDGIYLASRFTILNFTGNNPILFKDTLIFEPQELLKAITTYAKIVILPINLHIGRLLPSAIGIFDIISLVLFLFIFIAGLAIYRQKRKLIYFAFVWFWLILFSQSNLLFRFLIIQTSEHFLYFPLVGFFLVVGFLVKWLYQKNKFISKFFLGSIVGFYLVIVFGQNIVWRDSISLYRWTLKNSPGNFVVRNNLGLELDKRGLLNEAAGEFETALKYRPNFFYTHANLGTVYFKLGRLKEAKGHYLKAIELNPHLSILRENYRKLLTQIKDDSD
ncbi:MAG: tetratricopeptide repeat protein [Candidatus Omnitrophota bacterium]